MLHMANKQTQTKMGLIFSQLLIKVNYAHGFKDNHMLDLSKICTFDNIFIFLLNRTTYLVHSFIDIDSLQKLKSWLIFFSRITAKTMIR